MSGRKNAIWEEYSILLGNLQGNIIGLNDLTAYIQTQFTMDNWREIRHEILDALEFDDPNCKVKYYKPKDGYNSYFKVEIEDLFMSQLEVESLLEEIIEHHELDPEWESQYVLILNAIWDEEDSMFF